MNASASDVIAPDEAGRARDSGRALFWRLIIIYHLASLTAVAVSMGLGLLGLEFTARQWLMFWLGAPFGVAFFTLIDVVAIRRHLKPLTPILSALDRGERPADAVLGAALIRALNLPQLSAVRVIVLHGPMATLSLLLVIVPINLFFDGGIALWQVLALATLIFVFATPAHAIFEYFAVSRTIQPIAQRLSRILDGPVPTEQLAQLTSVPLRTKLLFLAIAVSSLPLIFSASRRRK